MYISNGAQIAFEDIKKAANWKKNLLFVRFPFFLFNHLFLCVNYTFVLRWIHSLFVVVGFFSFCSLFEFNFIYEAQTRCFVSFCNQKFSYEFFFLSLIFNLIAIKQHVNMNRQRYKVGFYSIKKQKKHTHIPIWIENINKQLICPVFTTKNKFFFKLTIPKLNFRIEKLSSSFIYIYLCRDHHSFRMFTEIRVFGGKKIKKNVAWQMREARNNNSRSSNTSTACQAANSEIAQKLQKR